jgi:WD40 repeat protein
MRCFLLSTLLAVSVFAQAPRTDQHGDPLPEGAIARFGTVRHRIGTQMVLGCAVMPNGKHLAVQTSSDITLWDIDSGRPVIEIEAPTEIPSTSALLYHGDGCFRWKSLDAETVEVCCQILNIPELAATTFSVSTDNCWVCSMADDGQFKVFDAKTGNLFDDVEPPPDWASDELSCQLTFSAKGAVVYLSKSGERTLRRDLKNKKWLPPLPAMPRGELVPHPDGKRLLLAGSDGVLHRFDLSTGKEIPPPPGFDSEVLAVPSPDGRRVAVTSGGSDGHLDMFDLSGKLLWSLSLREWPGAPHWSADGKLLACACRRELNVFDSATGKAIHVRRSPNPNQQFTGLAGFAPDGDRLFAALDNGLAVAAFDLKPGGLVRHMHTGIGGSFDISPDGRTMAFGNGSPVPALFDLSTGRVRVDWTFPPPRRRGCGGGGIYRDRAESSFLPDGSYLLTWVDGGVATLWNPETCEPERMIQTGYRYVRHHAFSAGGLWLAIAADDNSLSLWDVPTGKQLVSWHSTARECVTGVAFAGCGRMVSSSDDMTALLWDLRPRKKLRVSAWDALSGDEPIEAYRAVWALAEDPKGPELLRAKIAPAKQAPAGPLRKWIADLGADRYALREETSSVLEDFGRRIEPELREAITTTKSEEIRTRLNSLLAKLPRDRNETEVVHARAVAAMELAGTAAAKKLLSEWAAGAPGARLTVDAKAAMNRVGVAK